MSEPSLNVTFGQLLKALRLERNLSQEALAFNAELDRTFISLLERGKRQPSLSTLFVLAKALDVTASELIAALEKQLATSK